MKYLKYILALSFLSLLVNCGKSADTKVSEEGIKAQSAKSDKKKEGSSGPNNSGPTCRRPGIPQNVRRIPTPDGFNLIEWNLVDGAQSYWIWRGRANSGRCDNAIPIGVVRITSPDPDSYLDRQRPTPQDAFCWNITATNCGGTSAPSANVF